jgi:hypothetical protein
MHPKQDVDGRDKPGHDELNCVAMIAFFMRLFLLSA